MTDFLKAIQSGVESAINREKNFLEIHTVFGHLKEQLESVIKDNLYVEFRTINAGFNSKDYFKDKSQLYYDKKLRIVDNNGASKHNITSVFFDRGNGYPCTITIDDDEYMATDLKALEDNIKTLLSTSSIGFIIYSIKKAP